MDELDENNAQIKEEFAMTNGGRKLDEEMLLSMLNTQGIAERDIYAAHGNANEIPAGINLGGYCMMNLADTMLFFHRMKLRNNTIFQIVDFKNDLGNLQLKTLLHLNDLHLLGSYDLTTSAKPGHLFFEPSFGQIELLLKNVTYKMEGRYRLLKNRLTIEMIISDMEIEDVLLMYRNVNSTLTLTLQRKNIDVFIRRLKLDLDKWLKDYFNDYLMYYEIIGASNFEKYNQEKTKVLNNYADSAIITVIKRITEVKANAVHLPTFTIVDNIGKEIRLKDGVLRGLDTIYRRSIATGAKENSIRKIDAVVAFSNLKLTYRYDAMFNAGYPPVSGMLILTADDLNAHMSVSLLKEPEEAADMAFSFLEQTKPESLTVEGPASRMISNFKYMLERHIISIMMNTLLHEINMLSTLDNCVPLLQSYDSRSSVENSVSVF